MPLAAIELRLLRRLRAHKDVEMELLASDMALAMRMKKAGLVGLSESGRWAGITPAGLNALDQEGESGA